MNIPAMPSNPQPSTSSSSSGPQVRSRVTVVCAECKRLKLKCDRRNPCGSCTKRDTVARCIYSPAAAEKVDLHSLNNRLVQVETTLTQITSGVTPSPFVSSYPPASVAATSTTGSTQSNPTTNAASQHTRSGPSSPTTQADTKPHASFPSSSMYHPIPHTVNGDGSALAISLPDIIRIFLVDLFPDQAAEAQRAAPRSFTAISSFPSLSKDKGKARPGYRSSIHITTNSTNTINPANGHSTTSPKDSLDGNVRRLLNALKLCSPPSQSIGLHSTSNTISTATCISSASPNSMHRNVFEHDMHMSLDAVKLEPRPVDLPDPGNSGYAFQFNEHTVDRMRHTGVSICPRRKGTEWALPQLSDYRIPCSPTMDVGAKPYRIGVTPVLLSYLHCSRKVLNELVSAVKGWSISGHPTDDLDSVDEWSPLVSRISAFLGMEGEFALGGSSMGEGTRGKHIQFFAYVCALFALGSVILGAGRDRDGTMSQSSHEFEGMGGNINGNRLCAGTLGSLPTYLPAASVPSSSARPAVAPTSRIRSSSSSVAALPPAWFLHAMSLQALQVHDSESVAESSSATDQGDQCGIDYVQSCLWQVGYWVVSGEMEKGGDSIFPLVGKMVNIARQLGLGRDPDEDSGWSEVEKTARRRIWWEVICCDLFISDYMRHPPLITSSYVPHGPDPPCEDLRCPSQAQSNLTPDSTHAPVDVVQSQATQRSLYCDPNSLFYEPYAPYTTRFPGVKSEHESEEECEMGWFEVKCRFAQLVKAVQARTSHVGGYRLDQAAMYEDEIRRWLIELGSAWSLDCDGSPAGDDVHGAESSAGELAEVEYEADDEDVALDECEDNDQQHESKGSVPKRRGLVALRQRCELRMMVEQLVMKMYLPFIRPGKVVNQALCGLVSAAHGTVDALRMLRSLVSSPPHSPSPTLPPSFPLSSPSSNWIVFGLYDIGSMVFDAAVVCAYAVWRLPGAVWARQAREDMGVLVDAMKAWAALGGGLSMGNGKASSGDEALNLSFEEAVRIVDMLRKKVEGGGVEGTSVVFRTGAGATGLGLKRKRDQVDGDWGSGGRMGKDLEARDKASENAVSPARSSTVPTSVVQPDNPPQALPAFPPPPSDDQDSRSFLPPKKTSITIHGSAVERQRDKLVEKEKMKLSKEREKKLMEERGVVEKEKEKQREKARKPVIMRVRHEGEHPRPERNVSTKRRTVDSASSHGAGTPFGPFPPTPASTRVERPAEHVSGYVPVATSTGQQQQQQMMVSHDAGQEVTAQNSAAPQPGLVYGVPYVGDMSAVQQQQQRSSIQEYNTALQHHFNLTPPPPSHSHTPMMYNQSGDTSSYEVAQGSYEGRSTRQGSYGPGSSPFGVASNSSEPSAANSPYTHTADNSQTATTFGAGLGNATHNHCPSPAEYTKSMIPPAPLPSPSHGPPRGTSGPHPFYVPSQAPPGGDEYETPYGASGQGATMEFDLTGSAMDQGTSMGPLLYEKTRPQVAAYDVKPPMDSLNSPNGRAAFHSSGIIGQHHQHSHHHHPQHAHAQQQQQPHQLQVQLQSQHQAMSMDTTSWSPGLTHHHTGAEGLPQSGGQFWSPGEYY